MLTRKSLNVFAKPPTQGQVRYASKKSQKVLNQTSSMRSDLRRFLGPRNYKGFHKQNPFFFPSANHQTNYISQYPIRGSHRDGKGVNWTKVFTDGKNSSRRPLGVTPSTPFATNPHTVTNKVIPQNMKNDIFQDLESGTLSAQEASIKYGLSVPRVEAIVELERVRRKWDTEKKINLDLKRMARVMEGMLPKVSYYRNDGNKSQQTDDLSEIPMLEETRSQRFITIAESEPFGPIDAANVLGIESASTLLDKLKSTEDHHKHRASNQSKHTEQSIFAKDFKGEKSLLKLIPAKVGEIGYRYGAARDDQKHNRKVRYNSIGEMKYA